TARTVAPRSTSTLFTRTRPPRSSTPSPYTPLFRSKGSRHFPALSGGNQGQSLSRGGIAQASIRTPLADHVNFQILAHTAIGQNRSEEHTSELQSRENLVCRLLLEKKKHINNSQLQP